jgi:hypothetical protein
MTLSRFYTKHFGRIAGLFAARPLSRVANNALAANDEPIVVAVVEYQRESAQDAISKAR